MRTATLTTSQQQPSSRPGARCLARTDLFDHPLGRPRREHAALGGDPVVTQGEGALRAERVGADEPVLLPADGHGHPAEGQVDVGDHRAVLDPGPAPTARTREQSSTSCSIGDLAGRTPPRVGQDADVFETDEMGDDLVRIDVHRGVEDLLFHTLRLKRLCAYAVDPR